MECLRTAVQFRPPPPSVPPFGARKAGHSRRLGSGFFVFYACPCRSTAGYETVRVCPGYRAAHEAPRHATDRPRDPPREASQQAAEAVRRWWPLRHRCRHQELALEVPLRGQGEGAGAGAVSGRKRRKREGCAGRCPAPAARRRGHRRVEEGNRHGRYRGRHFQL